MSILWPFLWYATVVAALSIAERRWAAGCRPRPKDRASNFAIAFLVALVLSSAERFLAYVPEQLQAHGLLGLAFGSWSLVKWWDVALATVTYLLVWDFFQYWYHRLQHSSRLLWPIHA